MTDRVVAAIGAGALVPTYRPDRRACLTVPTGRAP